MTDGPTAGWYPDPHDPAHLRFWDGHRWGDTPAPSAAGAGKVFGRTFVYGFVVSIVTAAGSATAGLPVIGTIVGALIGVGVGVPVGLIVATVVWWSARPPATASAYRRRVDVLLVVLALVTAAIAVVWINQRALTGPWPALTMLAIVAVSLIGLRPLLRRLGPAQSA